MAFLTQEPRTDRCPFCIDPATAAGLPELVVHAGRLAYVVLNLYPYNNGHLLVLPYRHVADLTELTEAEGHELMHLLVEARRVLGRALAPGAFNVGMNLGTAAGAGIPGHLHFHIVPRWTGDTNFMPVIGDTKVLPETLAATKARLVAAWEPADR